MTLRRRVVFDCNTLLQAMSSRDGPARRCFRAVVDQRIELLVSAQTFAEFVGVASRPKTPGNFRTTRSRVDDFIDTLAARATRVDSVPHVFEYARDPSDAMYVDLAIATGANLIVSRDLDLLDLMLDTDEAGRRLRAAYPSFRVLTPPAFLDLLDADQRE